MDKMKKLNIIKGVLIVILLTFVFGMYFGGRVEDRSIGDIEKEMLKSSDITYLHKGNQKDLLKYYELDYKDYEGYLLYKAHSPMAVEELLIVKAKSEEETGRVIKSMHKHISDQKNNFEGYGAEQISILNKNCVEIKGKYIILAVGKNASLWRDRFEDFVEKR